MTTVPILDRESRALDRGGLGLRPMSRVRLCLAVVPAAIAAGGLAFGITLTSDHRDAPLLVAALGLLIGWSFIAAGLIARTRRPVNRTGVLLMAVGFWWLAGSLYSSNESLLWTIGVATSAVFAGFLVHLLLAYPTGRLESRWQRAVVATGYGLTALGNLPLLLVDRAPIEWCEECPGNAFLVSESGTASAVCTAVLESFAVVFLLAVVATLIRRWRRSSPAARRALTPVLVAGAIAFLLVSISLATRELLLAVSEIIGWASSVTFAAVPFLFLWGLLRSRLASADVSRALTEEREERLPRDVQSRIRRLLHDPTAELLIWCGKPVRAYADVEGRRRDLEEVEAPRAVIPIEREGRPLAAIVYDEALQDEPELVEEVAAAVGLEVARDNALFELQASERRSRALLDALPDKMFRVSGDGIILDIQEDQEGPSAGVQVGSSAYDAPVPREVTDRVMATGRLALETGERQTLEWELDIAGDLHHAEGRFVPSGDNEFFVVIRDVTERKRQEAERAALHRVALAVASESRAEPIFDLVTEEVGRVLGAHSANLFRYETDGEASVIVGRWSEPGVHAGAVGERFPLRPGAAAQIVYSTGRPVRIGLDDGTVQPAFARYMRRIGANSIVAAPITVTGRLWGVITARLTPPHSFPPGAEERLDGFARLVSLALANEEAREQLAASRARLVSTADEERRRLERNLHDGAQQRLVSLSLSLRRAKAKLDSDPAAANEMLSAASRELGVALEELRELARGIHPAVLTDRGLAAALQSLADRASLPVDLELGIEERLPPRVEAAAYYLVSEALANVAKYANASGVAVSVARENGFTVVEVTDDGVGGADPRQGSGLLGLTDRIEALDGTLGVHSPPGKGTTIRAEIPAR